MCKNKKEFDQFVSKYRELSAAQKLIDAQLNDVKKELKEYTLKKGKPGGKNGLSRVVFGDGYKVSCSEVNSTSLDSTKVAEYLGDKLPEFQKVNSYMKLDIR